MADCKQWQAKIGGFNRPNLSDSYLFGIFSFHQEPGDVVLRERRIAAIGEAVIDQLVGRGQDYLKKTVPLPAAYRRLAKGKDITIGQRSFRIITGAGHSPDQVML